ncbi:MAG: extracellular solute-binding protein [Bacillales bacterium]|jgi:spermidine/putrescine transport system substrate-binding protein|nr:extracellular solute-binding protein [Bacillales bacterium]
MKKTKLVWLPLVIGLLLVGCAKRYDKTLKVYSWQDYIDQTILQDFEKYYKAKHGLSLKVEYVTFETNEEMGRVVEEEGAKYDLLCPSDYYIQRLIAKDLLIPFDFEGETHTIVENYDTYASDYIKDLFSSQETPDKEGTLHSWVEYAVPYMWGTMGIAYNTSPKNANVKAEELTDWNTLWDSKYEHTFTMKNSVRDSYFIALVNVYHQELEDLAEQYENEEIDEVTYNTAVTAILNRTDSASVTSVKDSLIALKRNSYGMEVDSGKNDIADGNIDAYICWSGDAVYAAELAAENNRTLSYVIPELGSNIWFDGWVMPKGSQTELAQEFVNYLNKPEIAARNMNEVGYTTAVAGDAVLEQVIDWYSCEEDGNVEDLIPFDLSWFFEGTVEEEAETVIYVDEDTFGILKAQYPEYTDLARLTIMKDFADKNSSIIDMWSVVVSTK